MVRKYNLVFLFFQLFLYFSAQVPWINYRYQISLYYIQNFQVMYVGVTYTGNGPYRSEVPAISSRSLDSNSLLQVNLQIKSRLFYQIAIHFQIAQTAVITGTRMFVNSLARERYPINYIYGFDSEGFSYFLTTQMKQTSPSSYHSKLVRVCHDDSDYYSYTEIPIQCISGQNSEDFTLVQVSQSNVKYFS